MYQNSETQDHARPFGQSRILPSLCMNALKNVETQQAQGLSVRESRVAPAATELEMPENNVR